MYAIVDIETTGSYASANGITEISIHIFDGTNVIERFDSLVNPNQQIPRYIQAMTGISNAMVATAPQFSEIAEKVYSLLSKAVFVAHNVNFDFSFVKHQLETCGFELKTKKLCTVRLARKILPGYPSYSLGNICDRLGISNDARHRAGGDAAATVELFKVILANDNTQHIAQSLKKASKEQTLPPHVPKSDFDRLPYTAGVYYFYNQKGKIVYIGKAKNIRYRVLSHFSNNGSGRQRQHFLRHVHSIRFRECGTDLMAQLVESAEIKKWWPAFNSSQKRWEDVYGIFSYEDQNGYLRLCIEKNKKQLQPLFRFHYLVDGHAQMRRLIRDYQLCPRLCFMQKGEESCGPECTGACRQEEDVDSYNKRVLESIATLQDQSSYIIYDKGRDSDERSCILVLSGKLAGIGFLKNGERTSDTSLLLDKLEPVRENSFIRNLVSGYAARYPERIEEVSPPLSLPTQSFQPWESA